MAKSAACTVASQQLRHELMMDVKPGPFTRVDVQFGSVESRFGLCGSGPTRHDMIMTCGMMTSTGSRQHLITRSAVSAPELCWWIRVWSLVR